MKSPTSSQRMLESTVGSGCETRLISRPVVRYVGSWNAKWTDQSQNQQGDEACANLFLTYPKSDKMVFSRLSFLLGSACSLAWARRSSSSGVVGAYIGKPISTRFQSRIGRVSARLQGETLPGPHIAVFITTRCPLSPRTPHPDPLLPAHLRLRCSRLRSRRQVFLSHVRPVLNGTPIAILRAVQVLILRRVSCESALFVCRDVVGRQ